jgi:hypothetical protein
VTTIFFWTALSRPVVLMYADLFWVGPTDGARLTPCYWCPSNLRHTRGDPQATHLCQRVNVASPDEARAFHCSVSNNQYSPSLIAHAAFSAGPPVIYLCFMDTVQTTGKNLILHPSRCYCSSPTYPQDPADARGPSHLVEPLNSPLNAGLLARGTGPDT